VVDDNPPLRRFLALLMQSEGFEVDVAGNGVEALAEMPNTPDLIVVDLSMPVMGGREFFAEARRLGFCGPVVICSAAGAASARKELGAQAAFSKPFDPEEMVAVIRDLLRGALIR